MHAAPHRKMWFDAKTFRCWFKNGPATLTNVECCRFRPHHTLMSGHETVTGVKRESRGNNGRTLSQTRGKREEKIRDSDFEGLCPKVVIHALLCATSVFSVSVVSFAANSVNHRDTENTEVHREERSADFSQSHLN